MKYQNKQQSSVIAFEINIKFFDKETSLIPN